MRRSRLWRWWNDPHQLDKFRRITEVVLPVPANKKAPCCHFLHPGTIGPQSNKRKMLLTIQSSKSITFQEAVTSVGGWGRIIKKQWWRILGSSLASHYSYNISMRKGCRLLTDTFLLSQFVGDMNSFHSLLSLCLSTTVSTDMAKTLSQVISPLNSSRYQKKNNFNFINRAAWFSCPASFKKISNNNCRQLEAVYLQNVQSDTNRKWSQNECLGVFYQICTLVHRYMAPQWVKSHCIQVFFMVFFMSWQKLRMTHLVLGGVK